MAVICRLLLFQILLQDRFWSRALDLETTKLIKEALGDTLSVSFIASDEHLKLLRAELFRLRKEGLNARKKGGLQFKRLKNKLSNSNYSWHVPIEKHKCQTQVEALKEAICKKEELLCTLEIKFVEYVKDKERNECKLIKNVETVSSELRECKKKLTIIAQSSAQANGDNRKRKALQDCSNSHKRKIKKSQNDNIKNAVRGLNIQDCKVVAVLVNRHGKQELIHVLEADSENSDNMSHEDIDKLNCLIYILDAFRVSQSAYHELSMLFPSLPRSYTVLNVISKLNSTYNITNTPDGLGVQQSLHQTLEKVLGEELSHNPHLLTDGIVKIKLSGDGTRVGKRIYIFNFGFNIVSSGFAKQATYPLCITRTREKYSDIEVALRELQREVADLQGNTICVLGREFRVELVLGGDYKFLLVAVGISSVAATHPCVYCTCSKQDIKNLNKEWSMENQTQGARKEYSISCTASTPGRKGRSKASQYSIVNQPIFKCISPTKVVIDHLHLFLRITDKLFNLLVAELRTLDNIRQESTFTTLDRHKIRHIAALEHVLQQCGITFELSINRDTKKLEYRNLQGPEKLIFLSKFQADDLFDDKERASEVQKVWDDFSELNEVLKSESPSFTAIKTKAKLWCEMYSKTYQCKDITPYIHNLRYHVHELVERHGNLISFSQQGLEKLNDTITKQFFSGTNHKGLTAWRQVLEKQNRLIDLCKCKREKRKYTKSKQV